MEQMIATLREQIGRVRNNGARRRLGKALDKAMARKALREEVQRMRTAKALQRAMDAANPPGDPKDLERTMSWRSLGVNVVEVDKADLARVYARDAR